MNPHRSYSTFHAAAGDVSPVAWSGTVYRFVPQKYAAAKHLLSGTGALLNGGSFNHKGGFPVVYTALKGSTAVKEMESHCDREQMPFAKLLPRIMRGIGVTATRIVDLTNPLQLSLFGVTLPEILDIYGNPWEAVQDEGDEALTQAIGRAVYEQGLEGILVPSAPVPEEHNLVIFPQKLPSGALKMIRASNV